MNQTIELWLRLIRQRQARRKNIKGSFPWTVEQLQPRSGRCVYQFEGSDKYEAFIYECRYGVFYLEPLRIRVQISWGRWMSKWGAYVYLFRTYKGLVPGWTDRDGVPLSEEPMSLGFEGYYESIDKLLKISFSDHGVGNGGLIRWIVPKMSEKEWEMSEDESKRPWDYAFRPWNHTHLFKVKEPDKQVKERKED